MPTDSDIDVFTEDNRDASEELLGVPMLGHIPMIQEEGLRLIRDISHFSPLMECYRSFRLNIRFAMDNRPLRSLAVTSSVPAEGKSTVVANLAMALAMKVENNRVIIVDADLRRPTQHTLFKMEATPGLGDVLVGTHTVEQVLRPTTVPNVSVITAGTPPTNPAELLESAAMERLLAELQNLCDIVLLDTPPTLAVVDAVVVASLADATVVVIGFGETKKIHVQKTMQILGRVKANVIGTAFNRLAGPASGYYYGKYYVPSDPAPKDGPADGPVGDKPLRKRERTTRQKAAK